MYLYITLWVFIWVYCMRAVFVIIPNNIYEPCTNNIKYNKAREICFVLFYVLNVSLKLFRSRPVLNGIERISAFLKCLSLFREEKKELLIFSYALCRCSVNIINTWKCIYTLVILSVTNVRNLRTLGQEFD